MSIDKLPQNCVPKPIKCFVTEGICSKELGIEDGDPLSTVLDSIVESVECLKNNECDPCNQCGNNEGEGGNSAQNQDVGTLTTTGANRVVKVSTPSNLDIIAGNSGVDINYDFSASVSAENCTRTSTRVDISNSSTTLFRASSLAGTAQIKASDLPVSLNAQITCYNGDEFKTLNISQQITGSSKSGEIYLTSATPGTEVTTQPEVNEHFDGCISDLKIRVSTLENLDLLSKNSKLSADIDNNNESIKSCKEDLESQIKDLEEVNQTQADQINLMKEEIERLAQQYQSVYSLLIGNNSQ